MRLLPIGAALLAGALAPAPPPAAAGLDGDGSLCRYVEMELTPSGGLQLVAWIEDDAGNYVDTAYITRLTGTYGLGNRPGMMEFNSGPLWPYGRRTTTFPVWAHRHGLTWPRIIFQDEDEVDLSHAITQSSSESFYCRPIRPDEPMWDAQSCATAVFTDKGKLSDDEISRYPPRSDLVYDPTRDHGSVPMMSPLNPFDAVSRATPVGGQPFGLRWSIPSDLPDGSYVAWLEVSKEFDQNESYDHPSPVGIAWSEYGAAYRGQPSVLWRLPFEIRGDQAFAASATEYAGYGDPDGLDGAVREPDDTITTGVPGSGAGRLLLFEDDSGEMVRVALTAKSADDRIAPGGAGQLEVVDAGPNSVTLSFIAPGDDDQEGVVSSYEIRYRAGEPITEDDFEDANLAAVQLTPQEAGAVHTVAITGLLPSTNYYFGVRAVDECFNVGPVVALHAVTPRPEPDAVDACFVATAAYGSLLANEVAALRGFRDRFLRSNVPGELFVESYYTFGPALARLIEPSPTLRRAARSALAPLVERAASLSP